MSDRARFPILALRAALHGGLQLEVPMLVCVTDLGCLWSSPDTTSPVMSEYAAIPSTGKLKLKGVKDSRIDKKKKKKKPKVDVGENATEDFKDNSIVLKNLEDEDEKITKESRRETSLVNGKEVGPGAGIEDENLEEHLKTEAERRFDEQRRRRLEDRLKREGIKTHKQRVEELNKYLSGLSEHHDMPRIGPG